MKIIFELAAFIVLLFLLIVMTVAIAIFNAITTLIPIGFRCWFSKKFWDIHDYPKRKGGDGEPRHFYTYTCWNCGHKYSI